MRILWTRGTLTPSTTAHRVGAVTALLLLCVASTADAQSGQSIGYWLTFSSNIDAGYRSTLFIEPDHNTTLVQWDSRLELWLPPFRDALSWGPYVRIAGLKSSTTQPVENVLLGAPGIGFQGYPFSATRFRRGNSVAGKIFGPTRLFVEYNATNYWGVENEWRPDSQLRMGLDYWRALHVNDYAHHWWAEFWNGLYWQSSNEFTSQYDTVILANAARIGIRRPGRGVISALTPYIAAESSTTKNSQYFWENRLLLGGGVRISPSLVKPVAGAPIWISRLIVYVEGLHAAEYYKSPPLPTIPSTDVRVGVSLSLGDWYK
jgi:hypothetical protein